MTCIVGLIGGDGKVYIGADSAGSNTWQLVIRKDTKVFRNGDFLIGAGTSFRMIQLLRYALDPPEYTKTPVTSDIEDLSLWHEYISQYMATNFVDAVRDCLKDGGFAKKEAEQESGGVFLVGFQGRLFCIHSDYQVEEALCGYSAVGDGDDLALGSLWTTQGKGYTARSRVDLALQAAEYHCASVRAPFIIESI